MKAFHTALVILAFWAGPAEAHQDRILQVKGDGAIPDIPAAFGPMHLTLERLGSAEPLIQLTIGAHRTTLPLCVARMIRSRDLAQIRVLASWYHEESRTLPYYVNIQFFEPDYDPKRNYNSSQEFLFNLHNANLIHAKSFVADAKGDGGQYKALALPQGCKLDPPNSTQASS